MTRKEAERLARQQDTLRALGFTAEEAESLRRISMTLQRWHERECGDGNGCIERDEATNKPYWQRSSWYEGAGRSPRIPIPDRETGARKRLEKIIRARADREYANDQFGAVGYYIQGDPRGAALYILRPGDVPKGESADAYYTRGVCVY